EILVRGPIRDVVSLTFLPGLPTRLAVATQSELRLVDPETCSVLSFAPRENDQNFGSFIAAATNRLVMVGRDGRLEIIDAAKMQTVASIPAVRYEPVQLVASGNLILMKDLNGVVTLWSRQEKRALWSSLTRTDRDAVPTFSPDGKQVFLTSEWGVRVCLDAVTGKPSGDLRKKDIYSPAFFSPNGELSVRMAEKPRQFGEQPRQIEIVDAATGAVRHSIVLPPRFTPRLFAFSPDGKTLVALAHAGRGDQIIVLDTATGSLTRTVTLKSHGETLLFSPSGDALIITALSGRSSGVMTVPLASGGEPRMVEMPAVKPGVPLPRFAPMILHIAVSPDARIAALGKQDGSVAICDAATGTVLRELPAPQFAALYSSTGWGGRVEGVSALAFCADNTLAVSGGKRVRLFGVTTGQLQGTLRFVVTKSPVTPVITQQSRTQFLVTENPDTMSEWFWTTPEGKWDASAGVRSLVKRRTAVAELRPAHR
ncbi:MAG: YncE family protein, partial [Akkermansiaceae bacterium]|nr:YncE family protein [Armatimonadota bacterium]